MAFLDIKNVEIKGVSACVPHSKCRISDIYKWGAADGFSNTTGINETRHANPDTTASDLCYKAAETLIDSLGWDKSEIGIIIFVTQTPDYILPATSCILQNRLGLTKDCFTLDISLGCSGWVYALSVITSLMQNGTIKKGILLAGDTISKLCSPEDKSTYPLFGDAGTATAIEYNEQSEGMKFVFNSDGSGYETIIIRDGAYRNPFNVNSLEYKNKGENIESRDIDLELDGMNVFSFGITKAPKSIKQLCDHFNIDIDSIDLFTFHQANKMMNEMIRKKLKISESKVPYCMDEFGNTSCASIPLALVKKERDRLTTEKLKHIACGFGVGLSWGSVYFETNKIIVPELTEL